MIMMMMGRVWRVQGIFQGERNAMRRVAPGQSPEPLLFSQGVKLNQSTFDDDALQRVHPVIVVSIPLVWVTQLLCKLDFLAKNPVPVRLGHETLFDQEIPHRESLGFPGVPEGVFFVVPE